MDFVIFQIDDKSKSKIAIDVEQIVAICEISKTTTNIRLSISDPGWCVRGSFESTLESISDATNEKQASNDQ